MSIPSGAIKLHTAKGFTDLVGPAAVMQRSRQKLCADQSLDRYFFNADNEEDAAKGIEICQRCPELENCKELLEQMGGEIVGVMAGQYFPAELIEVEDQHKEIYVGDLATGPRDCPNCGKRFTPKRARETYTVYCKRECFNEGSKKRQRAYHLKLHEEMEETGGVKECGNPECQEVFLSHIVSRKEGFPRWRLCCSKECGRRKRYLDKLARQVDSYGGTVKANPLKTECRYCGNAIENPNRKKAYCSSYCKQRNLYENKMRKEGREPGKRGPQPSKK